MGLTYTRLGYDSGSLCEQGMKRRSCPHHAKEQASKQQQFPAAPVQHPLTPPFWRCSFTSSVCNPQSKYISDAGSQCRLSRAAMSAGEEGGGEGCWVAATAGGEGREEGRGAGADGTRRGLPLGSALLRAAASGRLHLRSSSGVRTSVHRASRRMATQMARPTQCPPQPRAAHPTAPCGWPRTAPPPAQAAPGRCRWWPSPRWPEPEAEGGATVKQCGGWGCGQTNQPWLALPGWGPAGCCSKQRSRVLTT